eukprot:5197816-Ditylum_brightwellii.AAC.1
MDKFCMAMDNYFTLPQVVKRLRDRGIGVVGTAMMGKGWPAQALRKTKKNECNFSNFRYLVDDNGTLVASWIDNGLVLVVSTIHHIGVSVKVNRRRSRLIVKNKGHVLQVWGSNHRADIYIPLFIHHYNQWMGGVDLIDQ